MLTELNPLSRSILEEVSHVAGNPACRRTNVRFGIWPSAFAPPGRRGVEPRQRYVARYLTLTEGKCGARRANCRPTIYHCGSVTERRAKFSRPLQFEKPRRFGCGRLWYGCDTGGQS